MKILDCTFRDGGYYTNWDFPSSIIEKYARAMELLPIDCLELGYRNARQDGYGGRFFHTPTFVIHQFRKFAPSKTLSLMINEKDFSASSINNILFDLHGLVDMIRIAINPARMDQSLELVRILRSKGFSVSANFMYLSETLKDHFWDHLDNWSEAGIEVLYLVDSFGSILPKDLTKHVSRIISNNYSFSLGFHGHNNLEAAFCNSLAAIESGCTYIDSTILGMGRGAGNLKTELWLAFCEKNWGYSINYNALSDLTTLFSPLLQKHQWGTNLAYIFSGLYEIPQKEVMDLVEKRYYSMNQILHSLQSKDQPDLNIGFDSVKDRLSPADRVILVGGGPSVPEHWDGIYNFLSANSHIPIVLASSKHADLLSQLANPHYYCLVGNEGIRLEQKLISSKDPYPACVLPPRPYALAHHIPISLHPLCLELDRISFTTQAKDIQTVVALQLSLDFPGVKEIVVLGYDGYSGDSITQRERELQEENETAFQVAKTHVLLVSVTPTRYKNLVQKSIYSQEYQSTCEC